MIASALKWPRLWAGLTLLFGLSVAACGLAVNDPDLSRSGLAVAVSVPPLLLLMLPTYQHTFFLWRRRTLLALAWAALGVTAYGLWRWAGDPTYANILAFACGTNALVSAVGAVIGIKYPWMVAAEQEVAATAKFYARPGRTGYGVGQPADPSAADRPHE